MLESIKQKFTDLIALYEGEKQHSADLSRRLELSERELSECRTKIEELSRQVDNLKLQGIFVSDGDNLLAKARLDKLIHEIDRCIAMLER